MLGFRRLAVELQVVTWASTPVEAQPFEQAAHREDIPTLVLPLRLASVALLDLRLPPQAVRRLPSGRVLGNLLAKVRAFAPTLILLESWPPVGAACALSSALALPIVYRSQNAEHRYWLGQMRAARGLQRLRLAVTAMRMRGLEAALRRRATLVLDIAAEDFEACERAGFGGRSLVLPATWLGRSIPDYEEPETTDVLYGGNLWTPNNVEGVRWFLAEVLPRLATRLGRRPTVRIAGATPSAAVRTACASAGVELVENPPALSELYRTATVLINPVRRGSGLNVKMLDMVASGRPIVATSAGTGGLPAEVRATVTVADDASDFALQVTGLLQQRQPHCPSRVALVQRHFGLDRLAVALSAMTGGGAAPRH